MIQITLSFETGADARIAAEALNVEAARLHSAAKRYPSWTGLRRQLVRKAEACAAAAAQLHAGTREPV